MHHPALFLVILAMFSQVLLTIVVMFIMGRRRFAAHKAKAISRNAFKTMDLNQAPEHVIVAGRNFSNQFEIPNLFFVACLLAITLNNTSLFFAVVSVLFVVSRVVHSYIHLNGNFIVARFRVFMVGCALLIVQWLTIIITLL